LQKELAFIWHRNATVFGGFGRWPHAGPTTVGLPCNPTAIGGPLSEEMAAGPAPACGRRRYTVGSMRQARTSRAEVVVLKGIDYGETDKILTLYTLHGGKVRAVAKGVRRVTSKMGGHLDLLAHATVLLVHGRNLEIVTQGRGLHSFPHLREDLGRMAKAFYAVELVDRFTEDQQPNPDLFRVLVRTLERIDEAAEPDKALLLFTLQLLALSGYRPQFHQCVLCNTAIQPGNNYVAAALGGVLCPSCGPTQAIARPISTPALKLLRNFQTRGESMLDVPVGQQIIDEVDSALSAYVQFLLERRPKSAAFLDTVRRMDGAPA